MDAIKEIKEALSAGKTVLGTDNTMKLLKSGKLASVFLSVNTPSEVRNDIEHYAKLSETSVTVLDIPNDELGIIVKKPFAVSVLAIQKE